MAAIPIRGFVEIARARVAFITLLLAILYYAFRASLLTTLEAAIQSINTGVPGLAQIARAIRATFDYVLHYIEARIAAAALAVESPAVDFLHAITIVAGEGAYAVAHTAERTLHGLDVLRRVTIPVLIGAAIHPLWRARHALQVALHNAVKAIALTEAFAEKESLALEKAIAKALGAAGAALHKAVAVPIPRALPWVEREALGAKTDVGKLWRALRKANPALLTALGGLLVLAGIRKLGMGWLRCSNVNRVGKRLCRTPGHLLDDLLALTADFFVLTSICRVIPWLETAFADVAAPLIERLGQAGAGLCGAGYTRPDHLAVPTLHLPDAVPVQLYLP